MRYDFSALSILTDQSPCAKKAASLFREELLLRGVEENTKAHCADEQATVSFCTDTDGTLPDNDCFHIEQNGNRLTVTAKTVRGLIFGYSLFLRKTVFENGRVTLIKCLAGTYLPHYAIRGHQVGYRTTPNTYDAWNYDQYARYYRDMMAFGANTCEHIPYENAASRRNVLMQYDEEEFLVEASRMADDLDMDVSLWFPNGDSETEESALERRRKLFRRIPRIDAVFPPGGDPGELYADEFLDRCRKISAVLKESHPNAKLWPSAQAPHCYPDWGEALEEELAGEPDGIDGLIMGPNHAFPLHELRKRTPEKYPMRFYPDITHNVRCEYPVHFLTDDWHFALASTLSRESVNPRPTEFRTLHRLNAPYMKGSVSYSEGVHDDVNKMLWSAMDFDPDLPLREAVADYARFFMPGADTERITDGIFLLEQNWQGDPLENAGIDATYRLFCDLKNDYPFLRENWRFLLLYFRACCDKLVRRRRLMESAMLDEAYEALARFDIPTAKTALSAENPPDYDALHQEIFALGETLFRLIGIQLDVEHYHTDGWERGATLDTIDRPVTDRLWLCNRLSRIEALPKSEREAALRELLGRNKVKEGEYYFSVALHGLPALGTPQTGEFYMDFQGDRPQYSNGALPMSMLKVYDHHSLHAKLGGFLPKKNYVLKIVYKSNRNALICHHKLTANGVVLYDGKQYGGTKDALFDEALLAEGFESAAYPLPAEIFKNGTLELTIEEPLAGLRIAEFWIREAPAGA